MGEVIRFPTEEVMKRDLRFLHVQVSALQTCVNIQRLREGMQEEAERAVASAPPGARATAFLQDHDPGDEDHHGQADL